MNFYVTVVDVRREVQVVVWNICPVSLIWNDVLPFTYMNLYYILSFWGVSQKHHVQMHTDCTMFGEIT